MCASGFLQATRRFGANLCISRCTLKQGRRPVRDKDFGGPRPRRKSCRRGMPRYYLYLGLPIRRDLRRGLGPQILIPQWPSPLITVRQISESTGRTGLPHLCFGTWRLLCAEFRFLCMPTVLHRTAPHVALDCFCPVGVPQTYARVWRCI